MTTMLWPGSGPGCFLGERLVEHFARLEKDHAPDPGACRWHSAAAVLADQADLIERQRGRLTGEQAVPPPAAAKYLAEWYGGSLGRAVGLVYALAGAGLLVDASVRWREHPVGWVDRVDVAGCSVAVVAEHPWAGLDGVLVLEDDAAVRAAVVRALVEVLTPVLAACRAGARVGWASVWAEVGDSVGLALTHCTYPVPEASLAVEPLRRLVRTDGAPWRKLPEAWMGTTAQGELFMGRKGGCCLAYTADHQPADPDDPDLDDFYQAWLRRFPENGSDPGYCSTCSFRDLPDVEARQRFWLEYHLTPDP